MRPASAQERRTFGLLQDRLAPLYRRLFADPEAPRTVVVVPSLSLEDEPMAKFDNNRYYEERLLPLLRLLRLPRTRLIYVTSQPISPPAVDYHLRLLAAAPGSPGPPDEVRPRLELIDCADDTHVPLSRKILTRPPLLERLRGALGGPRDRHDAHLTCYNTSPLELRLALALGIPLYGCDPELSELGSKSGSREIFASLGLPAPPGREHLRDEDDLIEALAELKRRHPDLERAVIKLEHGSAGQGNAIFSYHGCPVGGALRAWIAARLPRRVECVLAGQSWSSYAAAFRQAGGIVEAYIEGGGKRSPSVQGRIDPLGRVDVVSTHDQVLGGGNIQSFKGCIFPAAAIYRRELCRAGLRVGEELRRRGVMGRFGVDFVSRRDCDSLGRTAFRHFALEINLRQGGTTHPFQMLQLLLDGRYDAESGLYHAASGESRSYLSVDGLDDPGFRGLRTEELIARALERRLHYDERTREGVVFESFGALCERGRLALIAIARHTVTAQRLVRRTVELVKAAAREQGGALWNAHPRAPRT